MTTCIQAEQRTKLNRSGLKNLRKSGRTPAVVFGRNSENKSVHISTQEFEKWLRQGGSGRIELQFSDEEPITVLLEDMQRDPVTSDFLHVDFQLVQSNEIVRTKIPVRLSGVPVGTKTGGIVQVQSNFVEVEALPKHLPTSIDFDITDMEVGQSLLVSDVKLPSEVTIISGQDEFLVSIVKP